MAKFNKITEDESKMGDLLESGLGYDTEIMLFNGEIKKVQHIKVGDELMGDDSTSRTVSSLTRGNGQMYEITPNKGIPYIVNESLKISFKCSSNQTKKYYKGSLFDLSVEDFLDLPKYFHGRGGPLLGYKVGIEFPEQKIDIDPWIIGLWLGDGDSKRSMITTQDSLIYLTLQKTLRNFNMYLEFTSNYHYKVKSFSNIHKLDNELKKQDLISNKHIPDVYKYNSRENQLKLLAGLIDSDGYNDRNYSKK
jgi:replicative DNA helicase